MQQGGAGEYSDDAVQQCRRNDCPAVPGGRMAGLSGCADAFYRQLQQPGDGKGKCSCPRQEQCSQGITAPVCQQVAFEKGKFADGAPLEEARLITEKAVRG